MLLVPLKDGSENVIRVGDEAKISDNGVKALCVKADTCARVTHIHKHHRYVMESEIDAVRVDGKSWEHSGNPVLRLFVVDYIAWFDIKVIPKNLRISKPFMFKNKDLEGMPCKKIAVLDGGDYFVEMKEDVGGCSCDGLGKTGRCIVVKSDALTVLEKPKRAKKASRG